MANTNRVSCPDYGVITAGVPWARQNSRFTKDFENQVAWLVFNLSKKTLSEFMGVSCNTVGDIINRVLIDVAPKYEDRFKNLVNIGIDETSYRKGHNYITTVVNNDDSTVIWAAEGHSIATLTKFFELLTPEQRSSINTVSGDGARWIQACIDKYIPQARRCINPFYTISWARRCRIQSFVVLGRKIKRHYEAIIATRTYKISNAKTESLNNMIKLCIRRAYGFRSVNNLINSVLLVCSNIKIPLANR